MMSTLAGKDYLTVAEAADYAGISLSHWRSRVQREFPPGVFYGKLLYRRADVQQFIESKVKWPQSIGEERGSKRLRTSNGLNTGGNGENRLVALHRKRLRDSARTKSARDAANAKSSPEAPSLKIT
jgi:hypothetical protein